MISIVKYHGSTKANKADSFSVTTRLVDWCGFSQRTMGMTGPGDSSNETGTEFENNYNNIKFQLFIYLFIYYNLFAK